MAENPRYCAVVRRLNLAGFAERDMANASDIVDLGKAGRLRVIALTFPEKLDRVDLTPDMEVITDPEDIATIRAGLKARLTAIFERGRSPRSASPA